MNKFLKTYGNWSFRAIAKADVPALHAFLDRYLAGHDKVSAAFHEDIAKTREVLDHLDLYDMLGWMLLVDGEIAGFINVRVERQLHHERPVAEVCELVVDAGSRGSGRGARLFEEAVAYARACGCEGIEVTSNDRRARAHRFYEARGMERTHVKLTMGL